MRQAYKAGAISSPPSPPSPPSIGYPTEGRAGGPAATIPGEFWFYSTTEEIVNLIVAAGLTPSDATTQLRDAVQALIDLAVPTGTVLDFAGAGAPPSGYLLADGRAVSRTTYARLYNVIGVTYGAGDSATTFNLPDLRRRVTVGSGGTGTTELADTVGSRGGAETHALTVAELAPHDHDFKVFDWELASGPEDVNTGATKGVLIGTTYQTGGGEAHNNIQPSLVVNKIIKT